jgi:hypothetical protein
MLVRPTLFSLLLATGLLLGAAGASAAPPAVEIIAMPHPPVAVALKPLRTWLARLGDAVMVTEIDSESAEGQRRMTDAGLRGHIPILILIDGEYRARRSDGTPVAFVSFPDRPDSPPGARGNWRIADVEAVVTERMQ